MNNFFRAIIAGYGAKKLGGGCLGTIVVFVLIWVALGQCSFSSREVPPPHTYPAKHMVDVDTNFSAGQLPFIKLSALPSRALLPALSSDYIPLAIDQHGSV